MKRSEFLKRLGLGAVAAVAVPSLLKGEEKAAEYHKAECADSIGKPEKFIFWRHGNGNAISSKPTFISAEHDFNKQFLNAVDSEAHKFLQ